MRASASTTVGTGRRASTACRNGVRADARPSPGPTTSASAHSSASAASGSSSGPSVDSTVSTSGRLARAATIVSGPATSFTSPAPAASAARAACNAAPVMPFEPPTTVTRPRSPLCIVGVSLGSRAPAHPSVTSSGHDGSAGGSPMSTTTILPHQSRASRWPRRGPPNVTERAARTGPCASPLDRSSPVGPSRATTVAP